MGEQEGQGEGSGRYMQDAAADDLVIDAQRGCSPDNGKVGPVHLAYQRGDLRARLHLQAWPTPLRLLLLVWVSNTFAIDVRHRNPVDANALLLWPSPFCDDTLACAIKIMIERTNVDDVWTAETLQVYLVINVSIM
jgi:hypothetical protein